MNSKNVEYDWIIIGGGISGISISEILCREGKSVLLLEKNSELASETSKEFHEWVHSGALYTLVPDNLLTLRYLLGATDDLTKYYSGYSRMNLVPTESGIEVNPSGWFNTDHIEFRYRSHKFNPVWLAIVSRSIALIDMISSHDWLRRRAGSEYGNSKVKFNQWYKHIWEQLKNSDQFYSKKSPDFTMNSRILMSDILTYAFDKGLTASTNTKVSEIKEKEKFVEIETNKGKFKSRNIAICSPDAISQLLNIPIKVGYAPMAIVENVPEEENSFVELDFYIKRCINLLKKENGIGQAGGITLDKESAVNDYLDYVISEHKKRNPSIKVIDTYVGFKKELVQKGQERNYLYHINQHSSKVWSVVLGKFTLAFSMAPEFYRRIYHKNPSRPKIPYKESHIDVNLSDTSWLDIVKKNKEKHGND